MLRATPTEIPRTGAGTLCGNLSCTLVISFYSQKLDQINLEVGFGKKCSQMLLVRLGGGPFQSASKFLKIPRDYQRFLETPGDSHKFLKICAHSFNFVDIPRDSNIHFQRFPEIARDSGNATALW